MPSAYQFFVGADIAAASFTAAWAAADAPPARPQTFAPTPDGFTAFQNHLCTAGAEAASTRVVMEATGS